MVDDLPPTWQPASAWTPSPAGVDLWWASLRPDEGAEGCLTADELARARRFISPSRGEAFVAARSRLRQVLGRYVGAPAKALRFEYGQHGKPSLSGRQTPRFNLSHSGSHLLLAVCAAQEVGVDVELARPGRRFFAIAERFFAPDELARLRAVEDDAEATADVFYRFWACKEAYLKLHGTGLTFPSSDFSVALDPAVSRVEWTRLPGDDGVRWHLDAIGTPTPEYRAALCRGEAGPLRGFVLDESP